MQQELAPSTPAARLSAPFRSTDDLLAVLVPPLARLHLLDDHPDLVSSYASPAAPDRDRDRDRDAARFLRRQLGLVQKLILERVWPDWHRALALPQLWDRYFVPPPPQTALAPAAAAVAAAAADEIALSAYGVLTSYLASSASSGRQRRPPDALQFALDLLAKLSDRFSIEHLYYATLARGTSAGDQADPDPLAVARWDATVNDMLAIPDRAANAAAAVSSSVHSSDARTAVRNLPRALDPRY